MNFSPVFKRQTLAVALLALGMGAAQAASDTPPDGEERPHHGHFFGGDRLPPHLQALDLSDSQKAQIKALHEASRPAHEQTREANRALRDSLRELSPSAANYTQEVDRIAALLGQAAADRIREGAAMRAHVWAILTPSQQSQLAAMPKPERRKMRRHDK